LVDVLSLFAGDSALGGPPRASILKLYTTVKIYEKFWFCQSRSRPRTSTFAGVHQQRFEGWSWFAGDLQTAENSPSYAGHSLGLFAAASLEES